MAVKVSYHSETASSITLLFFVFVVVLEEQKSWEVFAFSFSLGLRPISLKISILQSSIHAPSETPCCFSLRLKHQSLLNVSCVASWMMTMIITILDAANRTCILDKTDTVPHLSWLIFFMK